MNRKLWGDEMCRSGPTIIPLPDTTGIKETMSARPSLSTRPPLNRIQEHSNQDPPSKERLYNVGIAKKREGDPSGAENNFKECLKQDPFYVPALLGLEALYLNVPEPRDNIRHEHWDKEGAKTLLNKVSGRPARPSHYQSSTLHPGGSDDFSVVAKALKRHFPSDRDHHATRSKQHTQEGAFWVASVGTYPSVPAIKHPFHSREHCRPRHR